MTAADALLAEQGREPCQMCHGQNHPLSEQLRFSTASWLWLCSQCGTDISGSCKDNTRDRITPYCGDKRLETQGTTEGNHCE